MVWSLLFPIIMQISPGAHADPLIIKPAVATQFVPAPVKPASAVFAPVATMPYRPVAGAPAPFVSAPFVAGVRPANSSGNNSASLGQLFQGMSGMGSSMGSGGYTPPPPAPARRVSQDSADESPSTESAAEPAKSAPQKTSADQAEAAPATTAPASPQGAAPPAVTQVSTAPAPVSPPKNDIPAAPPSVAPSAAAPQHATPEVTRAAPRPPPMENFPQCSRQKATSDPAVVDRMFKSILDYDGILENTLQQDEESHGMRGLWNVMRQGRETFVKISHRATFSGKALFCQSGKSVRVVIDISSAPMMVRAYLGSDQIITTLTAVGPGRIATASDDGNHADTYSTLGGGGRAVATAQEGTGANR
jgi:hypothetical protein